MRGFLQAALAGAAAAATFDWDDVAPQHDVEYQDCYDGFQCARLILPMDWKNETNNATVEIAITKLPAVVNDTDPTFGGPIFTNPGGPGGSGVAYIVQAGRILRGIFDIPDKKHYEIVSFDPRGIGHSTPSINCYPSGLLERSANGFELHGNGGLDTGLAAMQYGLALADAEARRCETAHGDFLRYVGTPNVARDMVAMVDQLHEERMKRNGLNAGQSSDEEDSSRLELRSAENFVADDVPRLQYVGFSYGTILGNYFASLFPERIGRIILDGVCNTDDYANGDGWLTNTVDADEVTDNFFNGCYESGDDCALYKKNDKSGKDIKARFWSWLEKLPEKPLIATVDGATAILRSSDFLALLTQAIYFPLLTFKPMAADFNAAMAGNAESLLRKLMAGNEIPALKDGCLLPNFTDTPPLLVEARSAVLCVDGSDIRGHNSTWWSGYLDKQVSLSKVAGALWTTIRLGCSSWQYQTNWPFRGPFKTPPPSKSPSHPEKGKPAAPLFFVSNRLDPVTPLRAAREMAKGHPGSGLLVQEAMGHTVMGMGAVNECTKRYVSEYLDTGVVPEEEVSCEAACDPWDKVCAFAAQIVPPMYQRTIHNLR